MSRRGRAFRGWSYSLLVAKKSNTACPLFTRRGWACFRARLLAIAEAPRAAGGSLVVLGIVSLVLVANLAGGGWLGPTKAAADVNGGTLAVGGPQVHLSNVVNQSVYATFVGDQGEAIYLKSWWEQGSNAASTVLYSPSGTPLWSGGSGTQILNRYSLPQTGTYKVYVNWTAPAVGTQGVEVWDVPADVDGGTLTANGPERRVSNTAYGQDAYFSFSGTSGEVIHLEDQSETGSAVSSLSLYAPDGSTVATSLPLEKYTLPQTGTYKLLFRWSNEGVGTVSAELWNPPQDVNAGTLASDGTQLNITNSTVGQDAYATLSGTQGQKVELSLVGLTDKSSYAGNDVTATVYTPSGAVMKSGGLSGQFLSDYALPATGTYKVAISWTGTLVGTVAAQLWNIPAAVNGGTITAGGPPISLSNTSPDQDGSVTFSGTQGQVVSLATWNATSTSSWAGDDTSFSVYQPNGTLIKSGGISTSFLSSYTLPASGTYTISVDFSGTYIGRVGMELWNGAPASSAPGNSGNTIGTDGSEVDLSNIGGGTTATLYFAGTAGQRVHPTIFNIVNGYHTWTLYQPDGKSISFSSESDANLTETGTYSIVATWNSGVVGTVGVRVWASSSDHNAGTLSPGVQLNLSNSIPAQDAYATFSGTAGQIIYLRTWNVFNDTGHSCDSGTKVTAPDGSLVGGGCAKGWQSFTIDHVTLPQTGTYTVSVRWSDDRVGTVAAQYWTVPADANAGTLPKDGSAVDLSNSVPGQNAYATFAGSSGEVIYLSVNDLINDVGHSDCSRGAVLVGPSGETIATGTNNCGAWPLWTVDKVTLPESGTYTLKLSWDGTTVGAVAAHLWDVPADIFAGAQPLDGSPVDVASTSTGQDGFTAFYGYAGTPVAISVYPIINSTGKGIDSGPYLYYLGATGQSSPQKLLGGSNSGWLAYSKNYTLPSTGVYMLFMNFTNEFISASTNPVAEVGVRVTASSIPLPQENGCDAAADAANDAGFQGDVNTLTGAYATSVTDIASPGVGVPLKFERCYSSAFSTVDGRLGYGWRDSFGASLTFDSAGNALFTSESSQQIFFYKAPDGSYNSSFSFSKLTKLGDGTYRLTRHGQDSYHFDANGNPLSETDRNGQGLTFAYTNGQLTAVTDTAGRQATLAYTNGRLSSVTFSDGRSVSYGYTDGHLTSVTDVRGKTWNYAYDAAGRLASIQDPKQNYPIRNSYDATSGRVVSQLDALDHQRSFAWDPPTQTATITDPAGKTWTDVYANNELVKRTDALGDTSTFTYDSKGDKLTSTDPLGNTTTMTYDGNGNMLTLAQPSSLGYSPQSWTYDGLNDVTSYTDALGNKTTYNYDSAGNLQSIVKPGNLTSTYNRDPSNPDLVDSTVDARGKTTSYGYNAHDELTSATDPDGNTTIYGYDAAGNRTTVTTPRGNVPGCGCSSDYTTTTVYDEAGNKLSVTDPLGNETTYSYDPAGNLASVVDARGNAPGGYPVDYTTTYDYDAANEQTSVTRPDNAVSSTSYDSRGLAISRTSPLGRKTTYGYDDAGRLTSVVAPDGNVAGCSCASQYTTTYSYDADGNRTKTVNALGGVTDSTYDALGRLTQTTVEELSGNRTTTYTYDADGNVVKTVDPAGRTTTKSYDANTRLTQSKVISDDHYYATTAEGDSPLAYWRFDESSGAATAADSSGNGRSASYVNSPTLGVAGDSGDGDTAVKLNGSTQYAQRAYDASLNPHTFTLEAWVDPTSSGSRRIISTLTSGSPWKGFTLGQNSSTQFYIVVGDGTSTQRAVTEPSAHALNQWYYVVATYDGTTLRLYVNGQQVGTPLNCSYVATTTNASLIGRDLPGNYWGGTLDEVAIYGSALTATQISAHYAAATGPAPALTTSYAYDNNGNLTSVTDPRGGVTTHTYDDAGFLKSIVSPLGNVDGCNCADQYRTSYGYDPDGNRTSTTDPLGNTTTTGYDANQHPISSTDPLQRETQWEYDPDGNLVKTTAPDQSTTTFTYDTLGHLSSRTDANGHTTGYGPDLEGEPTMMIDSLDITTYAYDADGNRTQTIDGVANAAGDPSLGTTTVTYNGLDEPTQVAYSDGTQAVSYDYDAQGTLNSRTDATGTTSYSYNADNELTGTANGGNGFSYAYDKVGNLSSETYPNGVQISYGYDPNRNLTSLSSGGSTTSYGYDANNELTSQTLPSGNGYTATLTYDHAGDLASLSNTRGGQTLSSYTLTRDAAGEPTNLSATNNGSNWTETYTYDPVGRLASVCYQLSCPNQNDPKISWTYDPVGNRTSETRANGATTTYEYNAANELTNATTGDDTTSYTYNADGEQTITGNADYTWNAAGELTQAVAGGQITNYTYDGAGLRTSATIGSQTTNYTWDESPRGLPTLVSETDGSNNPLRTYLYGASSSPAAMLTPPGGSYYYSYDAYGNVADLTDQNGATQWAYQYEPFGLLRSATNISGNAPTNPFQYAGQYTDTATGLSDMRARQYDPSTGSFLSVDPLGETSTLASSPYSYAGDVPTLYSDPSGLCLGGILGSGSCTQEISNGYHAVTGAVSDVYHAAVQPFVQTAKDDWSCVSRGTHCVAAAIETGLFLLPGGIEARDIEVAANELTRSALRDVGTSFGERITGGLYRLATEEHGSFNPTAFKAGAEDIGSGLAKTEDGLLNAADASAVDTATHPLGAADDAAKLPTPLGTDSQAAMNAAESATTVASGMGGETASMSIVRTVGRGEKVADLLNEGKALTFQSGNEHALVRLANGERAIVSGGPGEIEFPQGVVSRVIAHTHPYGQGAIFASPADVAMLDAYGQQSSWLLSEGVLSKFWAGG